MRKEINTAYISLETNMGMKLPQQRILDWEFMIWDQRIRACYRTQAVDGELADRSWLCVKECADEEGSEDIFNLPGKCLGNGK